MGRDVRPVLFLDFDGVLHPERCTIDLYFCKLPLLEAWLRQHPLIDVVVSSSWREPHSLDVLREFFAEDVQPRVIDVTPVVSGAEWAQADGELIPVRFEREAEIQRWLHASDQPWRAWAALDDQASLFRPFCPNLVVCNRTVGLTKHELDLVDDVLKTASR